MSIGKEENKVKDRVPAHLNFNGRKYEEDQPKDSKETSEERRESSNSGFLEAMTNEILEGRRGHPCQMQLL